MQLGASTLKLHVPDHVHYKVEVEVDGEEVELELELKWSTVAAEPAARPRHTAHLPRRAGKAAGPVSATGSPMIKTLGDLAHLFSDLPGGLPRALAAPSLDPHRAALASVFPRG